MALLRERKPVVKMETLPIELIRETLQQLDGVSLCKVSQVSKGFCIANEDEIWKVVNGETKRRSKEIIHGLVRKWVDLWHKKEEAYGYNTYEEFQEWRECDINYRAVNEQLSLGYRMLGVPMRLRWAVLSLLDDKCHLIWKQGCRALPLDDPQLSKINLALASAEKDIKDWEKSCGRGLSKCKVPYRAAWNFSTAKAVERCPW
jgi:hypothetical protein